MQIATQSTATEIHDRPLVLCGEEGGGKEREGEGGRGKGGGGGMWRERGRWRDVEGCGGREVSLTKSSYGLDRLLTHVHKQVHDSLQL